MKVLDIASTFIADNPILMLFIILIFVALYFFFGKKLLGDKDNLSIDNKDLRE